MSKENDGVLDYDDMPDLGGDEDSSDDYRPCVFCGCLIGDEVGYGDDWGEGPICENCAGEA